MSEIKFLTAVVFAGFQNSRPGKQTWSKVVLFEKERLTLIPTNPVETLAFLDRHSPDYLRGVFTIEERKEILDSRNLKIYLYPVLLIDGQTFSLKPFSVSEKGVPGELE
ncbi:MAG: hypothetical protein WC824_06035 [Bacteroidota bacterium]